MITNTIKFKKEVRNKILKGVETVADAVTSTLGPGGRNVMIQQEGTLPPLVTKDGVSVARSIRLDDVFENMGSQMVIEVASKTNTSCGDGTTTATLLAHSMYKNAVSAIENYGIEPMVAKRGMLSVLDTVKNYIKEHTIQITTDEETLNVAKISANGDEDIGRMVTTVIKETGNDGIVVVQEGNAIETSWSITKGMRLDSGFISPYFCNSNDGKPTCVLEKAYILFFGKKISNVNELFPIVNKVHKQNAPILIIADDFDNDVIATMVANRLQGIIKCCLIKTPGVMDTIKKDFLSDAAIATGGTVISDDIGINLSDVTLDMLGRAEKIEITATTTTFIDGKANEELYNKQIVTLKGLLEDDTVTPYMKHICKERLAKLAGGIAIIKVGGETRAIIHEKRDRIDDALCATREARSGGIVAGGGSTLFRAGLSMMDNKVLTETSTYVKKNGITFGIGKDRDEYITKVGTAIVAPALLTPFIKILENAGIYDTSAVSDVIDIYTSHPESDETCGINVRNLKFSKNLVEDGVIDPANVTLSAVTNAISVAALLISTDCMVGMNPDNTPKLHLDNMDM